MAGGDHKSFRQRFGRRGAPEDVTAVPTDMEIGTADEGSANSGPDEQ